MAAWNQWSDEDRVYPKPPAKRRLKGKKVRTQAAGKPDAAGTESRKAR